MAFGAGFVELNVNVFVSFHVAFREKPASKWFNPFFKNFLVSKKYDWMGGCDFFSSLFLAFQFYHDRSVSRSRY